MSVVSGNNGQDVVEEKVKNGHNIRCKRCNCLLLRSGSGNMIKLMEKLPSMDVSMEVEEPKEPLDFVEVEDIYSFENMGFSLTVENKKFLACPECELGPLGFHHLETKKSFLSLERAVQEDAQVTQESNNKNN